LIRKEFNINKINKIRKKISPYILDTPVISVENNFGFKNKTKLFLKLEFLQNGGSFKTRGAFNNILNLTKKNKKKGVVAVSAGNHAIAVSYASNKLKINNKVIMFKSSNPKRRQIVKSLGSKLIIAKNLDNAFEIQEKISQTEGKIIIHPFDGYKTLQGSATLGLDICDKIHHLDNIIISVGGGGLIAGVSSIIKQKFPKCKVIGIEPKGACGITKSLEAGKPLTSLKVTTIADSLGPPFHTSYSFSICQKNIDKMILISDYEMKNAMKFMAKKYNLILEPACVAGIAALKGQLKNYINNKNNLVILCGSNIDSFSWLQFTK